jgi:hypothetical protein
MSRDHRGGWALIAGAVGFIITMALHPTADQLLAPQQLGPVTRMVVGVHGFALVCLPISFFGALVLSRRLDTLGAPVAYGFGAVAVMCAAIWSGLLAPAIASRMGAPPPTGDMWRELFSYNGLGNQAFALVYAVASSAAIVLWSIALVQGLGLGSRVLGVYGCLLGPAIVIALFTGALGLGVHGFGVIAFGQAIWFIGAGASLLFTDPTRVDPAAALGQSRGS